MTDEFNPQAAVHRLEKRMDKLEWDHSQLDVFAQQMHVDQKNLSEQLGKIWTILNQLRWMAIGALALWMLGKYGPEALAKMVF